MIDPTGERANPCSPQALFELDLEPVNLGLEFDYVTEDSTLRVTLVPAPATAILAAPLGMVAMRRRR